MTPEHIAERACFRAHNQHCEVHHNPIIQERLDTAWHTHCVELRCSNPFTQAWTWDLWVTKLAALPAL